MGNQMEFFEFVGREFSEEIFVEAGDFIVITFEDARHVRIQIAAWEIDEEKFDLFLVKENDVLGDRFREKGAYFSEKELVISKARTVSTLNMCDV